MLSSTALRTDDTPEEAATVRGEGRMRETRLSETDMAAPSIACQRRRCQLRSRFRPRLLTVFLTTATVFGSTHRDVALSVSESQVRRMSSCFPGGHSFLMVADGAVCRAGVRLREQLSWPAGCRRPHGSRLAMAAAVRAILCDGREGVGNLVVCSDVSRSSLCVGEGHWRTCSGC